MFERKRAGVGDRVKGADACAFERTCGEGECCRKVVAGRRTENSRSGLGEGPVNCKLGR